MYEIKTAGSKIHRRHINQLHKRNVYSEHEHHPDGLPLDVLLSEWNLIGTHHTIEQAALPIPLT